MEVHRFRLKSMLLGIVGAWLAAFIFFLTELSRYGYLGSMVAITVGAVVLVFLISSMERNFNK
ncbi:MAG: GlsB/YeaQ/YmgE family stress response membrane protein [Acidobacteria bacterium]|nr:GlsB/YeaQ/YmgE family stress response membrane protein [Acidobacteriota bacterium]